MRGTMNHEDRATLAKMMHELDYGDGQQLTGDAFRFWLAMRAVIPVARQVEKETGGFDPQMVAERVFDFADRLLAVAESIKIKKLKP